MLTDVWWVPPGSESVLLERLERMDRAVCSHGVTRDPARLALTAMLGP